MGQVECIDGTISGISLPIFYLTTHYFPTTYSLHEEG